MAGWPKSIVIRGIAIDVNSWDELDEVIKRYGTTEVARPAPDGNGHGSSHSGHGMVQLTHSDRTLLEQFLGNPTRGLRNSELGGPMGAEGKGIKPKLDEWARRIGLTGSDGDAFEAVNAGRGGRGYRLTGMAAAVARNLLGKEVSV